MCVFWRTETESTLDVPKHVEILVNRINPVISSDFFKWVLFLWFKYIFIESTKNVILISYKCDLKLLHTIVWSIYFEGVGFTNYVVAIL